MKRNFLIILVITLCVHSMRSEEFVIEQSFYEDIHDASGTDPNNPKDANGIETAIVKVKCTMNDLVFYSDYIIKDPEYNHGVYRFFMAEGARSVEIRKKDGTILPITIKFADAGIKKLKRKCCYKMTIGGKDVKYYGKLIVNYGPAGARLIINGEEFRGGYSYEKLLEVGQYNIRVEKPGCGPYNEVVDITRDASIEKNIHLTQNQASISITTDELSDIYFDGVKAGKHIYNATTTIGTHRIKIKHGSVEEEHEIEVTAAGAIFKKELLGKLVDSYEKSNQNFSSGYDFLTPCKGNDMEKRTIYAQTTNSLLGDYKVTFNRTGYWSRSKKVHIEPVQTTTVYAPNLYKKKAWTFLSYQYSPKANAGLMLGICGKIGGYISGRYNVGAPILQQNLTPKASENTFGINCWAFDGGLMFRLCQELYVYAGAGFCTFESDGSVFATSPYLEGANVEAGIIANIHGKSGKGFTITGGYNTMLSSEYFKVMDPLSNITVGIGFAL